MNRPNHQNPRLRGLYVITQAPHHARIARAALHGGAKIIQLRQPNSQPDDLREVALQLRALTRQFDALFILNDHLELAREVQADGLHIEWAPISVEDAREQLGEECLISTGVRSVEAALKAQEAGADYLGVGPVYQTQSKNDAGFPIGLLGLRVIQDAVSVPVAAIGGLNLSNIGKIRAPMACVLSVLSDEQSARKCEVAARQLVEAFAVVAEE